MSDTVKLSTGQRATLRAGVVTVTSTARPPPHHFRMAVAHAPTDRLEPAITVRAATYDLLIPVLRQLERLDYVLVGIERAEGSMPNAR